MLKDFAYTILLHRIGERINSNFNTIEEIEEIQKEDVLLTFDGIYTSVYEHKDRIDWSKVILFVTGGFVGKDNSFDEGQPHGKFCTFEQILELMDRGAELGWHTWNHKDLTTLSDEQLLHEMKPIVPMNYIAYPYGKFNDKVLEMAKKLGYEDGFSVTQGDGSHYQRKRHYLKW